MTTFFLYLIKSVLCLTLFYPFYMVLLSRETFHRFNRIALLSILLASAVIPACRITTEEPMLLSELYQRWEHWLMGEQTSTATMEINWEDMELASSAIVESDMLQLEQTFSLGDFLSQHWGDLLFVIYLLGIVFLLIRHAVSLVRLFGLLRKGEMQQLDNGTRLYLHPYSDIAPFSWMKYIVISEADYHENGRQIVAHEQAHISNHHSWDLLLIEICLLVQWFNPAAWLLRQELQNIHEYEADETVLRHGINAKEYQLLIIKKAVGARLYSLANSLNHSSLKKRLTMMMKEKSHPWARLKYLYVLPLAAISMVAFAHTEAANNSNGISEAKGTEVSVNNQTSDEHSNEKFTVYVNKAGEYSYGPIGGTLRKGSLDDVANYIQAEREKITAAGGGQHLAVNVKFDKGASKESVDKVKETLRKVWTLRINYSEMEEESTSQSTEDEEVFIVVEENPEFPGGTAELMKFLAKEIKYPVEAEQKGKQGRVIVQFVVGKDGNLRDFKVVKSVSPELDAEAIRVCKAMPKWQPGTQRGQAVAVKYTIPISFRLQDKDSDDKSVASDMQVVSVTKANNEGANLPKQSIKDSDGDEVFQVVENMPEFPGGMAELMKFLQQNIKYPEQAQKDSIQGRVIVQFVINKMGQVTDPTIMRSVSPELDAEALRVTNAMPLWTPGKQKGKAVNVKFTLPITFKLNAPETTQK